MTEQQQDRGHWLDKYATDYASWELSAGSNGSQMFKRPLGLVESSFDADGTYYGGRADMTSLFSLSIQHKLSKAELRRRIAIAWTSLRLQHPLLFARVMDDPATGTRNFAVDIPSSPKAATQEVENSITWFEDTYPDVNEKEVYHHAYNVTRIIEPRKCLSKLHVLPITQHPDGTHTLRLLIIIAHQISDGLSANSWFSHFIRILNQPSQAILADIASCGQAKNIQAVLPVAQEGLYPPITGNRARKRWFWALIRVLRYVKKGLPPTFTNPLRRAQRLETSPPLQPKFDRIFDYNPATRPPMSCGHISASLSPSASSRLIALCRSANVSIGAGCFALAGLSMMVIHESLSPSSSHHPAFTASFPLNPRAFFVNPPPPDSCMLAFSEGIVMPFLSSTLPVEGRFKLVAKHANRELRVYQKRKLKGTELKGTPGILDKYSPGRLLATGYVAQVERVEAKLPANRRTASWSNPQGSLLPSTAGFGATCGVSSIGPLAAFFKRGTYDLKNLGEKDFAADFQDLKVGVRAREGEFLVGSSTSAEGIVGFGVSYDLNAISEEKAELWRRTIEGLLEVGKGERARL
ncbi:hypothetical protein CFE70_001253 [Pyrenophora teres f. teres 0-1]|uniref:Uncharacterized protein n=2 Tax=Pyrenophora teres f. teres TaxID=97479 RepID=E3RE30_PYRTT|nr:hypothetical protein PTT_03618 [Pyrenophora teres f. teres 0-1]KAE8826239.1 hypothetical protein PTNB85_09184 [Pyrenophora teres f. teres]KAE8856585.1 hypothetical protein PTNB73_09850 [Pyrenophora teres f. teres]CAE7002111.1 hypothetical protein PTTW11_01339 [Pyrenophora teres f. teres]